MLNDEATDSVQSDCTRPLTSVTQIEREKHPFLDKQSQIAERKTVGDGWKEQGQRDDAHKTEKNEGS